MLNSKQEDNAYAKTALRAAQALADHHAIGPVQAWKTAAASYFKGRPSAEKKVCPKSAFLGLAQEGFLKGVPTGKYTRSVLNRGYAVAAIKLLQQDASWAQKPLELWTQVAEQFERKQHNEQMHVVIALWRDGWLIGTLEPDGHLQPADIFNRD